MTTIIQPPRAVRNLLLAGPDDPPLDTIDRIARTIGLAVLARHGRPETCAHDVRELKPDLCIVALTQPVQAWIDHVTTLALDLRMPVIVSAPADQQALMEQVAQAGAVAILQPDPTAAQLAAALTLAWHQATRTAQLHKEIAKLSQRLEDRKSIERAKWILIQRLQIDEESAMRRLQKQARDHRRSLAEVSRGILESAELLTRNAG